MSRLLIQLVISVCLLSGFAWGTTTTYSQTNPSPGWTVSEWTEYNEGTSSWDYHYTEQELTFTWTLPADNVIYSYSCEIYSYYTGYNVGHTCSTYTPTSTGMTVVVATDGTACWGVQAECYADEIIYDVRVTITYLQKPFVSSLTLPNAPNMQWVTLTSVVSNPGQLYVNYASLVIYNPTGTTVVCSIRSNVYNNTLYVSSGGESTQNYGAASTFTGTNCDLDFANSSSSSSAVNATSWTFNYRVRMHYNGVLPVKWQVLAQNSAFSTNLTTWSSPLYSGIGGGAKLIITRYQ